MKMKREVCNKTQEYVEKLKSKGNLVNLSKTSKLGTYSWSLQALNTCPASIGTDGTLVDACKGCYATRGRYNYPRVKAPRAFNDWAWKQDSFVDDFVKALEDVSYFRWFDSGDMYHIELARKILQIMDRTPDTKHWVPTRMHKFSKFHNVLNAMNMLDNVVVRLSSDSIMGEIVDIPIKLDIETTSTIIPEGFIQGFKSEGFFVCNAPMQNGKCLDCRACYDKDVQTIAYIGHGVSMVKNQTKLINTVSI